jgi:hypothetical protein
MIVYERPGDLSWCWVLSGVVDLCNRSARFCKTEQIK